MNQAFPTLDGFEPSWADVKVTADIFDGSLIEVADLAGIKTGVEIEIGEKKPPGGRVTGRTTGSSKITASATWYKNGYIKLQRGLMTVAESRGFTRGGVILIGLVPFTISFQYEMPDLVTIFEVKIKGCRLMSHAYEAKEGTDPDTVETNLHTMEVVDVIDGKEVALI